MRKLLKIALAALAVTGVIVTPVTGALAHSQLESSNPADGAELSEPPRKIVLEFNEPVRKDFGQIQVTGPDEQTYAEGEVTVRSSEVTQELAELDAQGRYEVGWRVISADGHPVSGSFTFWVGAKSSGGSESDQEQTSGQLPIGGLLIGGLIALLVVAVLSAALLAARRSASRREQG